MDAQAGDVRAVGEETAVTDQQIAELRLRQRETIESALATERDPAKLRMWLGQLLKLGGMETAERRGVHQWKDR